MAASLLAPNPLAACPGAPAAPLRRSVQATNCIRAAFPCRVHAINCMRAAFQDAHLGVDTSAFLAPGMQAAIRGMAAPQWEVGGHVAPPPAAARAAHGVLPAGRRAGRPGLLRSCGTAGHGRGPAQCPRRPRALLAVLSCRLARLSGCARQAGKHTRRQRLAHSHSPCPPTTHPHRPPPHPRLKVRNAASLLFTALLVRLLGFRNHAGKVGPSPAIAPRCATLRHAPKAWRYGCARGTHPPWNPMQARVWVSAVPDGAQAPLQPTGSASPLSETAPQWTSVGHAAMTPCHLQGTVAAKRAPTAADFFARHPQLHPFLLQQLAEATDSLERGAASSFELHPGMFPVLVLLSRLRPSRLSHLSGSSGSSAAAEQQLSPAPFAPLLQRCAAARAAAVRQLAAGALPPLLPSEQQPAAATELAAAVAAAVRVAAGRLPAGQRTASRPSFNALHGQLLQLRALLEAAAGDGSDTVTGTALLAAVAGPLEECAADACCIDGAGSRLPAAVCLEYIRAAAAAAALAGSAQQGQGRREAWDTVAALRWLCTVRQHCWQAVERWGFRRACLQRCVAETACTQRVLAAQQEALTARPQRARPVPLPPLQPATVPAQQQTGRTSALAAGPSLRRACTGFKCGGIPGRIPRPFGFPAWYCRSAESQPPRDAASPMLSCAYKHATQLCFTALLAEAERQQATGPEAQQGVRGDPVEADAVLRALRVALQSRQYEVRCAALKVLVAHVWAARRAQRSGGALRGLLLAHLAEEQHHKAQRRALHLLAMLPPSAAPAGAASIAAGAAAEREFAAIAGWAAAAADTRVKQHAVCSLGPLLCLLLQDGMCPAASAAAGQLLALAAECGQPSQLPELRLAAAEALAASGLLGLDPAQAEAAAAAAADAWEALLPLLEDEDEAVRAAACAAAAAASEFGGHAASSCSGGGGSRQAAAPGSAEPTAPSAEHILRQLFPKLAARFGPHPALLSLLCRLCCPTAAAAAAGALRGAGSGAAEQQRAAASAAAATASGKIFDPEPDNMHEEPVLLAQVRALQLGPAAALV